MAQPPSQPLVADDFEDGDSAISVPLTDGLTSLRSSVRQFQEENGRTYHSMSSGKYVYPNDDAEIERLNIQHYLWVLTLHGDLARSPKASGDAKRVLDAGTGTGIWAIEFADQHPEAEVIGVDLSPIQPSLVPPNCSFEVDDLEKEWTWTQPFDFIFGRVLTGALQDYQEFFNKSFANLEPGGYLEMHDFAVPYKSDDGTLTKDMALYRLSEYFLEASNKMGRPMDKVPHFKSMLEKAGFVDVVEEQYKWPMNRWPKDEYYKELGAWCLTNVDGGLEGLTLAIFTRVLGWTKEETMVFCSQVRKQLRDQRIHSYVPVHVVYGRKPDAPREKETTDAEETETAPAPPATKSETLATSAPATTPAPPTASS